MVECLVANENVRSSTLLSCSTNNIMYKVYWTTSSGRTGWALTPSLNKALEFCETERAAGSSFVTMVSDYATMVGKPGAQGAGSEYVPQMLS